MAKQPPKKASKQKGSSATSSALADALIALETTLRTSAPKLLKKGAPLGKRSDVHPDVLALWKGPDLSTVVESKLVTTAGRAEWWTSRWLTPAESQEAGREHEDIPGFPKTLTLITTDDAGNFVGVDRESGVFFDWDHETRKARKLPGSLASVIATLTKLVEREAKAEAKPRPSIPARAGLPKRLKRYPSKALRARMGEYGRDYNYRSVMIAPDGDRYAFIAWDQGVNFGSLENDALIKPASERENQFANFRAEAVRSAGSDLAASMHSELQLWEWKGKTLEIKAQAELSGAKAFVDNCTLQGSTLRMNADRLAFVIGSLGGKDESWVCVSKKSSLPKTTIVKEKARAHKPDLAIPLTAHFSSISIDLDSNGEIFVDENLDYPVNQLSLFSAEGKQLARTKTKHAKMCRFLPDGTIAVIEDDNGAVIKVLDRKLNVIRTIKTGHKESCHSLELAPSGAFAVTGAKDEIFVWSLPAFEKIIAYKEKPGNFGGLSVSDNFIFTDPPRFYALT